MQIIHGKDSEGFWTELLSFETPGGALIPAIAEKNGKSVLALDDRDGASQTIVRVNRELSEPEALYQHHSTDAMGYHADANRDVYAVDFGVGQSELFFIKPDHPDAITLKALKKVFPESDVSIVDSAANGRLLLAAQSSDVVPATYYLFDRETNQLRFLTSQRPWVDEQLVVANERIRLHRERWTRDYRPNHAAQGLRPNHATSGHAARWAAWTF